MNYSNPIREQRGEPPVLYPSFSSSSPQLENGSSPRSPPSPDEDWMVKPKASFGSKIGTLLLVVLITSMIVLACYILSNILYFFAILFGTMVDGYVFLYLFGRKHKPQVEPPRSLEAQIEYEKTTARLQAERDFGIVPPPRIKL